MAKKKAPVFRKVHTLIIGSGAAGLSAAVQLHRRGVTDILILSEGLDKGTSINTGSDKQTYYKLSLCGSDADAPRLMAQNYFAGGSMHGDLALTEAATSAQAFLNLVGLGVKFPQDAYGQFIGYKTDHDPRKRATSVGPYTSRDMCLRLIDEVKRRKIEVIEKRVVVLLPTIGAGAKKRVAGAIAVNPAGEFESYAADNIVFATGGPGGLYQTSVYPAVHTGGIGLAMLAGARCQSLPEAQYGLASTKFRWNVSGTYMQVIPRFISTGVNGEDAQEFLRPYFKSAGEMNSLVFLKGYQWPFDPRKVCGGSSLIDILVYIETVVKGRRVWLDFRANPADYGFTEMSAEAQEYLRRSGADALPSPLARLRKMNPGAITLYKEHKIDLAKEPLEIAVCAQHNNGGLAGNHWWESPNLRHFFPIGEVNGSHGVYRPGGAALNSGQVGAIRAAEYIASVYTKSDLPLAQAKAAFTEMLKDLKLYAWPEQKQEDWRTVRTEFQSRMSRHAAHIRSADGLKIAVKEARRQWARIREHGGGSYDSARGFAESLRNIQLCYAHLVYLEATLAQVRSRVGSRGSALVLDPSGTKAHPQLPPEWCFAAEDEAFRQKVLETTLAPDGRVVNKWVACRPLPESDEWFETAWAAYRAGGIYK